MSELEVDKMDTGWKLWTKGYRNSPMLTGIGVMLLYIGVLFLVVNLLDTKNFDDVVLLVFHNLSSLICIVLGVIFLIRGLLWHRNIQKKRKKLEQRLAVSTYCYGRITGVFYQVVHPETSIDSSNDNPYLESYVTVAYEDDAGNVMSTVSDEYFGDLASCLSCNTVKVYGCMDEEGKPVLELPWRKSKDAPFISFAQYRYTLSQRNLIYWIMRNGDKVLYVVIFFAMLLVTISNFTR